MEQELGIHSSSEVVDASAHHIVYVPETEDPQVTSSNNISGQGATLQGDRRRRKLARFLNMNGVFIQAVMVVVTQMHNASEKQKNICLGLLAAMMVVFAMELWGMTRKFIILEMASNSTHILAFYLALCVLKPGWLSLYGFVTVIIIGAASTFYDELKAMLTWCYEKGAVVIKYVTDKFSKLFKDQGPSSGANDSSTTPNRASA